MVFEQGLANNLRTYSFTDIIDIITEIVNKPERFEKEKPETPGFFGVGIYTEGG